MIPYLPTDEARTDLPASSHHASAKSGLSEGDLLLWSALPDLTLNIAQTAALCGVSVRQLGYWTKQGYVTASGAGARRLYGPDSLRRILAIRQSMHNGLSLRQALRALAATPPTPPPPAVLPALYPDAADAPGPGHTAVVSADLRSLFDRDRHVHDSASGLAAKLGRRTDDVSRAVEGLVAEGTLKRLPLGGDVVYAHAGGGFA